VPPWWFPIVRNFELRADRAAFGLPLQLTSQWRSIASNLAAKGSPQSQHLVGTARDYTGPRWAEDQLMRNARALGLVVIDERQRPGYRPHVHVQGYPAGAIPLALFAQIAR